jgi:hypothetical protein
LKNTLVVLVDLGITTPPGLELSIWLTAEQRHTSPSATMADESPEATPPQLFHDVIFTVINRPELLDLEREKVYSALLFTVWRSRSDA